MPTDNPDGSDSPMDADPDNSQSENISAGHAAYNVVSDTVIGLNVRKSDNKFQAMFILAAVLVLAAVGAILAALNGHWKLPWYGGALIGSFAGLVIGVFASGIFLMVYRAVRHLQGKHALVRLQTLIDELCRTWSPFTEPVWNAGSSGKGVQTWQSPK